MDFFYIYNIYLIDNFIRYESVAKLGIRTLYQGWGNFLAQRAQITE